MDETGTTTVQVSDKIIATMGKRQSPSPSCDRVQDHR
ncbi:hypothetical protein R3I94_018531 [Phoxinus phoxinus]